MAVRFSAPARGLALGALVTFAPKLVARFRLQHLLDDQLHRQANQIRAVSPCPQPSIDEPEAPRAPSPLFSSSREAP